MPRGQGWREVGGNGSGERGVGMGGRGIGRCAARTGRLPSPLPLPLSPLPPRSARGNHLEHWLNGFKTIEVNDDDPNGRALEGLIALQIHAGPPMLVEFKDILLKNL